MKVEIYLTSLENNLTKASTAIKEFKSLLTSVIIKANERLRFLQSNDWRNRTTS